MKLIHKNEVLNINSVIETKEIYEVFELDDGREIHKITKHYADGHTEECNILEVIPTIKKFHTKCYLCDQNAKHKITIANEHVYYCELHAAETLKDLIIYKVATKYWYKKINSIKKDYDTKKIKNRNTRASK